jgi:hypothetical protein
MSKSRFAALLVSASGTGSAGSIAAFRFATKKLRNDSVRFLPGAAFFGRGHRENPKGEQNEIFARKAAGAPANARFVTVRWLTEDDQ